MAKKSKGIGLANECAVPMPYRPSAEQKAQEKRYRAEDDLRTLRRAEEVRSDPGRVRMAQRVAREEVKVLSRVAGKKR